MEIETLLTPEFIAGLPNTVLILLFIYFAIVRDLDRRLNGLSSYIKRFLAIQNRRAKGQEALATKIEELCNCLSRE